MGGKDSYFSLRSSLYLPFKQRGSEKLIKHLSFQESPLMCLTLKTLGGVR